MSHAPPVPPPLPPNTKPFVPRNISVESKNGGYSWFGNGVHQLIVKVFPNGFKQASVYTALCSLASDESGLRGTQVPTFRASFKQISERTGCSRDAAINWIKDLKQQGFIKIKHAPRGAENREQNQYTLASLYSVEEFQRELREKSDGKTNH